MTIVHLGIHRRVGVSPLQPALRVVATAQRHQIAVAARFAIMVPHQFRDELMPGHLSERGPPPLIQLTPASQTLHHKLAQRAGVGHYFLPPLSGESGLLCLPGGGGGGSGCPGGGGPSLDGSGSGGRLS
ncbi:MAG TPA: hypothetical protein VFO16_21580 [Pseudonocardiaceae bacterium]|nr:hypothetical protein [Pseudonocardiaceae bacterium]